MKILAVDLGDARTGLACCDAGELLASPVGVLHERDRKRVLRQVADKARELGAQEIVVGHPVNMDGSLGERAQLCAGFAEELRAEAGIPVLLWDERGTTISAHGYLNLTDTRGKKRKNVVDAVAATIILESYLLHRANRAGRESG